MEQKLRTIVAPGLLVLGCTASFVPMDWLGTAAGAWLAPLRTFAFLSAGGLYIALGARHARRCGATPRTLAVPIAGGCILILLVVSAFAVAGLAEDGVATLEITDLDRAKAKADTLIADPETSPEDRARISRLRARMVYTRTGEIVPVVDAAGQTSPFQPTTGDVEHHHAELQLRAFAVHTRASAGRTLRDVAVVAIGALVLGAGTPVRRAATG